MMSSRPICRHDRVLNIANKDMLMKLILDKYQHKEIVMIDHNGKV